MRCSTKFLAVMCLCFSISLESQAQTPRSSADAPSTSIPTVDRVDFNPEPHGLTIKIVLGAPAIPQTQPLTNPDRLVFDFPGFKLEAANREVPVHYGPVQHLRAGLFQSNPPITRIVVDLKEQVAFHVTSARNTVLIEIPFPDGMPASANSTSSSPALTKNKSKQNVPIGKPETKSEPEPHALIAASHVSAYSLQAKAKALRLEDLQDLEDRAAAGDPEAETTLALAYNVAVLLRRNDAEALRLLHKAAEQGFMAAEESLGIFSEMGIGMKQPEPIEALDWYKKATEQGSLDAATNIALMYADGIGIPKDQAQALIWFRRAAQGGDATAQYNLALRFRRGDTLPQDTKESLRWLIAAADQDVVPAMLDLGFFYLHPSDGTPANAARAIHYYERAAERGSSPAQALLGNIFADGVDGKPDYMQAVKWYSKAAEQGQPDAQFGLAQLYARGEGVSPDLQEALRLFRAAADQGHAEAQYDLATMYEEGKGIRADRSLATHYYEFAAEQGLAQAQFRLGRLLATNKESRNDQISAYKWLMLAQASVRESSPALSDLRKSMNHAEISEAEREVDNWRIAHPENQRH